MTETTLTPPQFTEQRRLDAEEFAAPTPFDILTTLVPAWRVATRETALRMAEMMTATSGSMREERVLLNHQIEGLGRATLSLMQVQYPQGQRKEYNLFEAEKARKEDQIHSFMYEDRLAFSRLSPRILDLVAGLALGPDTKEETLSPDNRFKPEVVTRTQGDMVSISVVPASAAEKFGQDREGRILHGYPYEFNEARSGTNGLSGPLYEEVAHFLEQESPRQVPEAETEIIPAVGGAFGETLPPAVDIRYAVALAPSVEDPGTTSGQVVMDKFYSARLGMDPDTNSWWQRGSVASFLRRITFSNLGRRHCRRSKGYENMHTGFGQESKEKVDPFETGGGTLNDTEVRRQLAEIGDRQPGADEAIAKMPIEAELGMRVAAILTETTSKGMGMHAKSLKELCRQIYDVLELGVNGPKRLWSATAQANAHRVLENLHLLKGWGFGKRRACAKVLERILAGEEWDGRESAISRLTCGELTLERRPSGYAVLRRPRDTPGPSDTDWQGFAADPETYRLPANQV